MLSSVFFSVEICRGLCYGLLVWDTM